MWTLIKYGIHNIRAMIHAVLHKHIYLTRGLEEMIICSERWPLGKAVINYRPHAHAPWVKVYTIEEFDQALSLGGKWDAYE